MIEIMQVGRGQGSIGLGEAVLLFMALPDTPNTIDTPDQQCHTHISVKPTKPGSLHSITASHAGRF